MHEGFWAKYLCLNLKFQKKLCAKLINLAFKSLGLLDLGAELDSHSLDLVDLLLLCIDL